MCVSFMVEVTLEQNETESDSLESQTHSVRVSEELTGLVFLSNKTTQTFRSLNSRTQ